MKGYIIVTVWALAMVAFSLADPTAPMHHDPVWLMVSVWTFWWIVGVGVVSVWRWRGRVKAEQRQRGA